ncbi:MAG: hypothetical protein JWN77_3036 [Frankiales bacterium]|jgi:hypothetical protein|nr:hypothetical protein [Frankiales bacterium]
MSSSDQPHSGGMTSPLTAAASAFILERGPLTIDELHRLALERELTRARTSTSLRTSLAHQSGFVQRPDGRYDTAARLLRGSCFTTRPRRPPSDGVLWLNRDIDPLLALGCGPLPLKPGGEVQRGAGSRLTWVGPEGWLPDVPAGELLALRWDGSTLDVWVAQDVPAADSAAAADARSLLAAHASARHRDRWTFDDAPPLTETVLSALVEDPRLFAQPLPPLSELLPLPEHLRPTDAGPPDSEIGRHEMLHLPLPGRVHRELSRRADLLGEHVTEYAAMLLGAAADRVLPPERRPHWDVDEYEPSYGNVVGSTRWGR